METPSLNSKRLCSRCHGRGPFGKNLKTSDGLKSTCKKCCAEKQAAYRIANPNVWSEWAAANADHLKAKDASRYAANPEAEKARVRSWQLRNPDKFRTNYEKGNLKKYGLTPEDRDAMLRRQRGKCLICSSALTTGRTGMQVDHDHNTGRIRGLLCHLCNMVLGDFREQPTFFENAAAYLALGTAKGLTFLKERPPGAEKVGTRVSNLWYGYGLTLENIQELLDLQGGSCGICRDPLKPGASMHIDHDHALGKKAVRGLLCRQCNLGLGHARENPRILRKAQKYLSAFIHGPSLASRGTGAAESRTHGTDQATR